MARQGRSPRRAGRARRAAGNGAAQEPNTAAMDEDEVLTVAGDDDWNGEPEWAVGGIADDPPRRRRAGGARVHTPAWQLIDRYREDKWLRERIREVYDD